MVTLYYKYNDRLIKETGIHSLSYIDFRHLLWIDLNNLEEEEKQRIFKKFHIQFQDRSQLEEIESSSRFIETDRLIVANSNFLIQQGDSYVSEPASFILKNNYLITYRNTELRSFNEIIRKLESTPRQFPTGYHIMVSLFETRIDLDADHLESIARNITVLSKAISNADTVDKDLIFDITNYQETTMQIRQNIIDKQRVISALMRSEYFPKDFHEKLRIIIKDIASLLDHSDFNFERLEYLQDTFMGLINIEQNKIIKIFTVVSVVFMPPTLIASMYGMNFRFMPELEWGGGYAFAIILMISSSLITLYLFKKRKWL